LLGVSNSEPLKKQLTFGERLSHAVRVRSPLGIVAAAVNGCGRTVAPMWWVESAPWYVGRAAHALGVPVTVDGATFDSGQMYLAGLLCLGNYETVERYAVAKHLPRHLPVVELGASIGVVSCLIDRLLVKPAIQIAVEANPRLIPVLEANRVRNNCQFEVLNAAVAYGGEAVEFGISESTVSGSLTKTSATTGTAVVRTASLTEIVSSHRIERCTLVCDIEGAEGELVRREGDVLQRHVDTLIIEVHPGVLGDDGVAELARELRTRKFALLWNRGDVWVMRNSA
jgi:FkbM family methyltransferase